MNMPLIRFEVESMRHSLVHAFSEHLIGMDSMFQEAVSKACDPVVVQSIINEAAARYLREAVDAEVKSFLMHGEGRRLISSEVEKRLKKDFPQ